LQWNFFFLYFFLLQILSLSHSHRIRGVSYQKKKKVYFKNLLSCKISQQYIFKKIISVVLLLTRSPSPFLFVFVVFVVVVVVVVSVGEKTRELHTNLNKTNNFQFSCQNLQLHTQFSKFIYSVPNGRGEREEN
jgi:hypothetical protein